MAKKKAIMIVMNTLDTDARVQRAAGSIQELLDLTLIGVGKDCGQQRYQQVLMHLKSKNSVLRYFEFINKIKNHLRKNQFDVFYAHDYFSAALVPWVRNKVPQSIIVYDSHELIFPAKGFLQSKRDAFFSYFERKALKAADIIICASNERAILMKEYYEIEKELLVVENISQLPIISDTYSENLLRTTQNLFCAGRSVLVYAGVLSKGRKIDALIDIVANRDDTALLIIGSGPDSERLHSIAEERIPGRFHFTGSLPYKYMGLLLQHCDVGYISYPTDTLNNTYCASNKLYEYASVNLPMIAPENPTIRSFFEDYNIGVIDSNLGAAFDAVRNNIQLYKNNCTIFTETHQWNEKAALIRTSIETLLNRRYEK